MTTLMKKLAILGIASLTVAAVGGGGEAGAQATHQVKLYNSGPALQYLVKIDTPERCSGAMIQDNQVITAAHCVIDRKTGKPSDSISVEVGGVTYKPAFAIYDQAFVEPYMKDKKNIAVPYDVVILSFTEKLNGKIVKTGVGLPSKGQVVAIGYQSTWPDTGKLLRPKFYGDKSYLKPGVNKFNSKPAACTIPVAKINVKTNGLTANCGLIPGASGGPLLSISGNEASLVGVLSTVSQDLTKNTWVRGGSIARIIGRAEGVIVYSLNGPVVGAPPFRS